MDTAFHHARVQYEDGARGCHQNKHDTPAEVDWDAKRTDGERLAVSQLQKRRVFKEAAGDAEEVVDHHQPFKVERYQHHHKQSAKSDGS
mmetsp:Transcript_35315/g.57225  ORF Transcript_35315/g.57225 Transcript_35315/m.57225 type:complete len:89 (+) Transcript_35315:27-293(+)